MTGHGLFMSPRATKEEAEKETATREKQEELDDDEEYETEDGRFRFIFRCLGTMTSRLKYIVCTFKFVVHVQNLYLDGCTSPYM